MSTTLEDKPEFRTVLLSGGLTAAPVQMPKLIEGALSVKLTAWVGANRPEARPTSVSIHVANREELRSRPCIGLATSDTKPVSGARHTARIKLNIHLFSQVDDSRPSG